MSSFNFNRKEMLRQTFFVSLFFALPLFFYFYYTNFADNDSFFYIREAWRLRAEGIFNTSFPWTYFSSIKDYGVSLWWGFFVILMPFTFFNDLGAGIKIAGTVFAFLALLIFYLAVKKEKMAWSFLWPVFYIFSAPNILYRFLMVRPQIISTALSFLLLVVLDKQIFWAVGLISFFITWIHFNFFWVPFVIFFFYFFVKIFLERKADFFGGICVLGGVLAGWILRPDFIEAAKLVYIQIVKHTLTQSAGIPLLFGDENQPLLWVTLFRNFLPVLVVFIFCALVLARFYFEKYKNRKERRVAEGEIFLLSSFLLASVFFILTMFSARRAYDFWVGFTVLFAAAVMTHAIPKISYGLKSFLDNFFKFGILSVFIIAVIYSINRNDISMKEKAFNISEFKEASSWLKKNSQEGDIVFNLNWSNFSQLFYWNQKNYYVGGLDPIFQYVYNPSLYWKFHYLSLDEVTKKTCGKEECRADELEDTYEVLKDDFKARYVFLEKAQNPAVFWYLGQDSRFEKKFENKTEAVFEVK